MGKGRGNPYHDSRGRFCSANKCSQNAAERKRKDLESVQKAHEQSKEEIFCWFGGNRCHASVVDKLPEKTSKWSLGYADMGVHEWHGQKYRVYHDKDGELGDVFANFAVKEDDKEWEKLPNQGWWKEKGAKDPFEPPKGNW